MNRVAEFSKVSFEQFYEAMKDFYGYKDLSESIVREIYDNIQLPKRATSGSAGYDFKSPIPFVLRPGCSIKIPTGIRVKIVNGWWLGCLPRSGLGFKYRLQLDNTMGVIDSDYYGSDNEGHIFVKATNDTNSDKIVTIKAGDGFVQGIFIPFGITYDDDADGIRNGGFGSTSVPGVIELGQTTSIAEETNRYHTNEKNR